jgi:TonB family protein
MINEFVRELVQATIAGSAAVLLLLCLRRPLRARFGALTAYRAWLLVPLAIVAVWLPGPPALAESGAGNVGGLLVIGPMQWVTGAAAPTSLQAASLLASTWAAGALLSLLWFASRQLRFQRLLERKAGSRLAIVAGHGPALIGWWRSLIVLPEDFRERYTRGERRLVLAHEIAHLRRGDIHAQLLATGLRSLFWFNPLLHYAARLFRFDQELACDATVLARFPRGRARYGSAMLKTQLAGFGLPVGCHWQSSHPLKERIEMLKHPLPARTQKRTGAAMIAVLMCAGTWAAWAAQPAQPAQGAQPARQAKVAQTADAPFINRVTSKDILTAPTYPKSAGNVNGSVVIELLVGADGYVKDVQVIRSTPAGVFDQAAIDAARKWYVSPGSRDHGAIEERLRTEIQFLAPDKK